MDIKVKTGKFENTRTSLLAVCVFKETNKVQGWLKELDVLCEKRLSEIFKSKDFKGDLNDKALVYAPVKSNIRRILLVGMGKRKDFDLEKARQVFGTAVKFANSKRIKKITVNVSGLEDMDFKHFDVAQALAEGARLSLYNFTEFKTEEKEKEVHVHEIQLHNVKRTGVDALKAGVVRGELFSKGTIYCRDLAAYPPNIVTPKYLADEAKKLAKESGLKCSVFDQKKLEEMGMNALVGVGKGSKQPPFLVTLEYKCGKKKADTIAVVGKGITFDSGGISLKPGKKMDEMKFDMSGAGAVLGLMKIVSDLKLNVNVVGVVAAAENLPGSNALKPGDIVKSYSGLTIEIINTDAEGRLVLADALAYTVEKYKPDAMIDLATLTGAVVVALGHYSTGMLGTSQPLMKKLKNAGEKSGEKVWQLPLYPEFDEHIKGKFGDLKNSNGPGGGTIYGASFLKKFVGKVPWVHLDIAGTAWDVKEKSYIPGGGPTGVGVRLFSQMLLDWK